VELPVFQFSSITSHPVTESCQEVRLHLFYCLSPFSHQIFIHMFKLPLSLLLYRLKSPISPSLLIQEIFKSLTNLHGPAKDLALVCPSWHWGFQDCTQHHKCCPQIAEKQDRIPSLDLLTKLGRLLALFSKRHVVESYSAGCPPGRPGPALLSCFPVSQPLVCTGEWGYSFPGAELATSLYRTSQGSCCCIAPVFWGLFEGCKSTWSKNNSSQFLKYGKIMS